MSPRIFKWNYELYTGKYQVDFLLLTPPPPQRKTACDGPTYLLWSLSSSWTVLSKPFLYSSPTLLHGGSACINMVIQVLNRSNHLRSVAIIWWRAVPHPLLYLVNHTGPLTEVSRLAWEDGMCWQSPRGFLYVSASSCSRRILLEKWMKNY